MKISKEFLLQLFFELLVVFTGIISAFMLNEWKAKQEEKQRKIEIYMAICEDLDRFYRAGEVRNKKGFINLFKNMNMLFENIIAARGELPTTFYLYGDYWHIEIIDSFIKSGIIREIDLTTAKKVVRFNTIHQNFLKEIQELNDFYAEDISTNHDKGIPFFYKDKQNELKDRYQRLQKYSTEIQEFAEILVKNSKELSNEIKKQHIYPHQ